MKQGNYLQALNRTLKIKDCGRTRLGGKKKKSGSKRCIVISITQTGHLIERCWPRRELLRQRERGAREGRTGVNWGWQTAAVGWPGLGGSDGVQGPPGSYVWVTAPQVQNRDSGFAGYR